MERNFREMTEAQWDAGKFLCIGLDTDYGKIPQAAYADTVVNTIVRFNKSIIDATKDIAGFYKPNSAFYEQHGEFGMVALQQTIQYIHEVAPEIPVILDAKRADIGNTNQGYVGAAFEYLTADAITVHPYLGAEALQPFLEKGDRGVFILCRTSNAGAGELQDVSVTDHATGASEPLYMHLARMVREKWNTNGNCGLVVGATYPGEMKKIRAQVHDMPFLIPGVGTQGGDIKEAVENGKDGRGKGMIINVSRAILFASSGEDFAGAARAKAAEIDSDIRHALVI